MPLPLGGFRAWSFFSGSFRFTCYSLVLDFLIKSLSSVFPAYSNATRVLEYSNSKFAVQLPETLNRKPSTPSGIGSSRHEGLGWLDWVLDPHIEII